MLAHVPNFLAPTDENKNSDVSQSSSRLSEQANSGSAAQQGETTSKSR